jgi:hypothetical protein
MDKKIVSAIGAVAGLAALDGSAQAAAVAAPSPDVMNAKSYAELLDPIPNAISTLRAADATAALENRDQAPGVKADDVQVAQYHHHHHHHHHRVVRRIIHRILRPHHHHHHHHHHNY